MDSLLSWATGEIDRHRIDLMLSTSAHYAAGNETGRMTYSDALSPLAQNMASDDADRMLLPGEAVGLSLPGLLGTGVHLAADAQVYWFTHQADQGPARTIWLETASSILRKLQYVQRYALGGFLLCDAVEEGSDQSILDVLRTFQDGFVPPEPRFVFVWTVHNEAGGLIDHQLVPLTDSRWTWTAPNNPGDYVIGAAVSDDGGESDFGPVSEVGVEIPTPTPTSTPTPSVRSLVHVAGSWACAFSASKPRLRARGSRISSSRSVPRTAVHAAPSARATWAHRSPIAPGPSTRTVSPGAMRVRVRRV